MHAHTHTHTCAFALACTHARAHATAHMCVHTRTCANARIHAPRMHAYMTHTCMHNVCAHGRMHARLFVCVFTCARICLCLPAHACMYNPASDEQQKTHCQAAKSVRIQVHVRSSAPLQSKCGESKLSVHVRTSGRPQVPVEEHSLGYL